MNILSLGYLGFETSRHEEWATFGPEVMGLGVGHRGPDGAVYLKMDERRFRLAFHPGSAEKVAYIGWELRDFHAFEAALKKLTAKGIPYQVAGRDLLRERGVTGMASFLDPAGFTHEIFFGQAFWPYSFVPGRPISGFIAGDLGLGHVVLGVPEFKPDYRDFAVEVLGFRVFAGFDFPMPHDGRIERLEFYKCNPRTHVLGYTPYPGLKGIQHVGIDTGHIDDVGTCIDICAKRQIPIATTLGRHVLDDTVSFYFRTPTGFLVEYGCGPRLQDDEEFIAQSPDGYAQIWGHVLDPAQEATTLLKV